MAAEAADEVGRGLAEHARDVESAGHREGVDNMADVDALLDAAGYQAVADAA